MISFISIFLQWLVFSYFFICSFITDKHPEKFCTHCVGKFHPRSWCIIVVKSSNVFYLRFLWRKSLFQIVTKCANNYRFLKNMFPLQNLINKNPLVNKISVNIVLMRQLQTNLITMNNVLFRSDCKVFKYLFSLQKF